MIDRLSILEDDFAEIKMGLKAFDSYSFSKDLKKRMTEQPLASSELAKRCQVSQTMVNKWKSGKARPKGKERFIELGLALGMNAASLDTFLLNNGYPVLYVKHPLDSAAHSVLLKSAEHSNPDPNLVEKYRELVQRLNLNQVTARNGVTLFDTTYMNKALQKAVEEGHVSAWFLKFRDQLGGSAKTALPDYCLARFIHLYIGDSNVYELAVAGDLPPVLQNLLYPVLARRGVSVKGLREKLIAFGLYSNMTEKEIDDMLHWARLLPLSEPVSPLDFAIKQALNYAHSRNIFYEWENIERLLPRVDPPKDEFETQMLAYYTMRKEEVASLISYYDKHPEARDKAFEEIYTSICDRGVMDYVHDLLVLLIEDGALDKGETEDFLKMISRNDDGDTLWD